MKCKIGYHIRGEEGIVPVDTSGALIMSRSRDIVTPIWVGTKPLSSLFPLRSRLRRQRPRRGAIRIRSLWERGGGNPLGLETFTTGKQVGFTTSTKVGSICKVQAKQAFGSMTQTWVGSTPGKTSILSFTAIQIRVGSTISRVRPRESFGIIRPTRNFPCRKTSS